MQSYFYIMDRSRLNDIELACLDYLHTKKCTDPWVMRGRRVYSGEYIFQCCGSRHGDDLYGEVFVNSKEEINVNPVRDPRFKEHFEKFLDQNTAS